MNRRLIGLVAILAAGAVAAGACDKKASQKNRRELRAAKGALASAKQENARLTAELTKARERIATLKAKLGKRKQDKPVEKPEWEKIDKLNVAELAKALKGKAPITVCDANRDKVRKQFGVIPGAILLSGKQYDPAKELPKDKARQLVFYCSGMS